MSGGRSGEGLRVPGPGALAKDTARGLVGVVVVRTETYVRLRRLTGGKPWDARPAAVRPLAGWEELSARLTILNSGQRWGR